MRALNLARARLNAGTSVPPVKADTQPDATVGMKPRAAPPTPEPALATDPDPRAEPAVPTGPIGSNTPNVVAKPAEPAPGAGPSPTGDQARPVIGAAAEAPPGEHVPGELANETATATVTASRIGERARLRLPTSTGAGLVSAVAVRRVLVGLMVRALVLIALLVPVALGAGLLPKTIVEKIKRAPEALIDIPLSTDRIPLTSIVRDRTGAALAYVYDQYRLPVRADQISEAMKSAVIAVEDRRFYSDPGVDPLATLRAVLHDSGGGSRQGASTISQQYVKNYLINVVDRGHPVSQQSDRADTLARKLREAQMAIRLDHTMTKNDILTGYLNLVEFSGNVYGVAAAAAAYFHTTAAGLSVPQAALLAGMVNNPNLYNPYVHPQHATDRRNLVLDDMVATGSLTSAQGAQAKASALGVVPGGPTVPGGSCLAAAADAGFFCDYVLSYLRRAGVSTDQLDTGGYTITTTMDPPDSAAIKSAVELNVPTAQPGVANTFALIKPQDGQHQVLAMVANRNLGTAATQGQTSTNIVSEPSNVFGAGSSFKIFTTAAALEQGRVGFTTELANPGSGCFTPPNANRYTHCYPVANDGESYPNPISLQNALASSPNVAFVDLETKVGMSAVLAMAQRLGLRHTLATNLAGTTPITDPANPRSRDPHYNQAQSRYFQNLLSFTLGDSPVSTLEMANVSATLIDGGTWCPPTPILSISDRYGRAVPLAQQPCEQVVSKKLADTLLAGLSQDTKTGTSAAAAAAAGWNRPDIGKTGTTNQSESVTFVGGVNGYAASSMLFADGAHPTELCPGPPVHLGNCGNGAFGGTAAAPPYFQAMNHILGAAPNQPIPGPDPDYLHPTPHPALVPSTIGQSHPAAEHTLTNAGYPSTTAPIASPEPRGQVIAQTPQGNVTAGTPITLYTSTGPIQSPHAPAGSGP